MAGDPVAKKAARRAPAKKAAAKKAPAKKAAAKRAPRKAAAKVVAPAAAAALAEIENPEPPADPWVRARAAHVALMGGDNWEAAASEHGFDDVRDCQMQVRAYLSYVHTMTGDEEREVAKRLELERLDAMHKQWWELGTVMRDKDAAQVLLAIGKRRAELLELTAKDLSGVIAESTLWRVYHDQNAPTARIMYALTTILDVKVEDIFDPVVLADGEEPPSTHKRSL
jgi:hypothetical protein